MHASSLLLLVRVQTVQRLTGDSFNQTGGGDIAGIERRVTQRERQQEFVCQAEQQLVLQVEETDTRTASSKGREKEGVLLASCCASSSGKGGTRERNPVSGSEFCSRSLIPGTEGSHAQAHREDPFPSSLTHVLRYFGGSWWCRKRESERERKRRTVREARVRGSSGGLAGPAAGQRRQRVEGRTVVGRRSRVRETGMSEDDSSVDSKCCCCAPSETERQGKGMQGQRQERSGGRRSRSPG